MRALRVAFGVLAATAATPAAVAAMFAGGWYFEVDGFAGQPWAAVRDQIALYAMLSAPVAFFLTISFGAPYTHRLRELGRATVTRVTLTGAVLGSLPFLAFDGYVIGMNILLQASEPYTTASLITAVRWAGLGAWCGFWSAFVYWVFALRTPAPSTQHLST